MSECDRLQPFLLSKRLRPVVLHQAPEANFPPRFQSIVIESRHTESFTSPASLAPRRRPCKSLFFSSRSVSRTCASRPRYPSDNVSSLTFARFIFAAASSRKNTPTCTPCRCSKGNPFTRLQKVVIPSSCDNDG